MKSKERIYYFDNLKAVLIFLVVVGHALTMVYGMSGFARIFVPILYIFHMPLFVFVSGYFSKKEYKGSMVLSLLVPCYIISCLFMYLKFNIPYSNIFGPPSVYWYIYSLILWRLVIKDISKIKYIFFISLFLSVISGLFDLGANVGSLMKTICFLPFFILGYQCTEEKIMKIKNMKNLIFIFIIIITSGLIYIGFKLELLDYFMLLNNTSFSALKYTNLEGIIMRSYALLLAFPLSFIVLKLVSKKKNLFSYLGKNTLTIYLFHMIGLIYVIKAFKYFGIAKLGEITIDIYMVFCSLLIVLFLGSEKINKIYNYFVRVLNKIFLRKN